MHMITNFIKGSFQFLLAIWIVELVGKIFLRRTLAGKITIIFAKDIWLSLKLGYRILKHIGKKAYIDSKKLNNMIYRQYKKFDIKKEKKIKKVVNENIINFEQVKKKHR